MFLSIFFTVTLFTVSKASDYYCRIIGCSDPERHVMCLYSLSSRGANCGTVERIWITQEEKQQLLNAHNAIRKRIDTENKLLPLQWDIELENVAQRWANQCPTTNDECRSIDTYKSVVQQNIGYKIQLITPNSGKRTNFTSTVENWSNLLNNPVIPRNQPYKNFDRIGCGVTVTSKLVPALPPLSYPGIYWFYLVCNYASTK